MLDGDVGQIRQFDLNALDLVQFRLLRFGQAIVRRDIKISHFCFRNILLGGILHIRSSHLQAGQGHCAERQQKDDRKGSSDRSGKGMGNVLPIFFHVHRLHLLLVFKLFDIHRMVVYLNAADGRIPHMNNAVGNRSQ